MNTSKIVLGVIGLCFTLFSFAQQNKTLKVGDKAPALYIQEWIKGESITEFKQGHVYVVEFSGTWCPPCRKAIPHLTELSKKYKNDLRLISVYNERNNKEDSTDLSYLKKIYALVNAMGERMDFIVAADVPMQTTSDSWGVTSFPTTFLIDGTGRIAWEGNPMDLSPVLAQVVAGTFNAEIAIKKQEEFNNCINSIRKIKKDGDYLTALKGLDSLITTNPEKKAWLFYEKFGILAGDDDKQAYHLLQEIIDGSIEDFDWPHFVGSMVVNPKIKPENRNFSIELRAINKTIEESETEYHSAYPLSLKAITYDKMGNYKMAIEACKDAIKHTKAPGGNSKETKDYERQLVFYKFKQKAESSIKEANSWLTKMINNKEVTLDNSVINAVFETKQVDYDYLLWLIDKSLQEKKTELPKIWLLGRKADIYVIKGDYEKAISFCQKAVDISREAKSKAYTDVYEKKLAELKQKAGIK